MCGTCALAPVALLLPSLAAADWVSSLHRAQELISQMTPEEKRTMVQGTGWSTFSHPDTGHYIGNTGAIPRLGIPALKMYDGPQGWRAGWGVIEGNQMDQVVSWPCGMAVSATWDENAMKQYAAAIGGEFRDKGANTILGPCVDLVRVPKYGRNPETIAGEDPYFASIMATHYVNGVHSVGILATMKHFIGNNQETNRQFYNAIVDQRTLWEVYYPPYNAAIRKANLGAVMCAYNRILGKHSCEQSSTLQADLKQTMGFHGFVMTDWWAAHSANASGEGLDQVQPGNSHTEAGTGETFANAVAEEELDSMVERVLTPMIEHRLLDQTTCSDCDWNLYEHSAILDKNVQLATRLAQEGTILLKNNGVLPIGGSVKKLAIVGEACDPENRLTGLGWNQGSYYAVGGSGRTLSSRTTSIAAAVTRRAWGASIQVLNFTHLEVHDALASSADADLVLICGGATSGEDQDRNHLRLDQHEYIKEFLATTKVPTVVAMSTPGPVVISAWQEGAAAIANMFLAGEATGHAWAAVLFGDANPSGKLPVTFPATEEEAIPLCPSSGDCVFSEKLEIGYRGLSLLAVDFPFGHGLSYTTFEYESVSEPGPCKLSMGGVHLGRMRMAPLVCTQVNVTNTGGVAGAEVVQLYLRFPEALGEPERVLKDFHKVFLEPGETRTVTLSLWAADLSIWDYTIREFRMGTGHFMAMVGSSSKDIRITHVFYHEGNISEAPPDDPTFPEACPGNSLAACQMQCIAAETDEMAIEECKTSICAERCGQQWPDYFCHLKSGCSNLEGLVILRFDAGQGNCRAFCAGEPECSSYQLGRRDKEHHGECVLLRDGCQKADDEGYDLFLSAAADVRKLFPFEQEHCGQCWTQEGQNGEDNACGYWCGRAVEEGCDAVGCSASECDFCGGA